MKVTGTSIKGEIKIIKTKLASALGNFKDSFHYFETDSIIPDPISKADNLLKLERELAIWQTAQKKFNLTHVFEFKGRKITLQEAIACVGGYSRIAGVWKDAAGGSKQEKRRFLYRDSLTRSNEVINAKESISKEKSLDLFVLFEKDAEELRKKIGIANNIEVDMPWLDTKALNPE